MADYIAAKITFGGELPEDKLELLAELIQIEGLGIDWEEYFEHDHDIINHLKECSKEKSSVTLYNTQAYYGGFPDFESWLTKENLYWCRHTSAKYEYDAILEYRLPGMGASVVIPSNDQEQVLIPVEEVVKAHEGCTSAWDDLLNKYQIPDIPPLNIITEVSEGPRQTWSVLASGAEFGCGIYCLLVHSEQEAEENARLLISENNLDWSEHSLYIMDPSHNIFELGEEYWEG